MVRAPTKAQRKLFFKLRSQKTRLGWFKSEEIDHVAETLGVTRENVIEMENRLNNHDIAFDLSGDDDEDSAYLAPATTAASSTSSASAGQRSKLSTCSTGSAREGG